MTITVALIAAIGTLGLGLPVGAATLLGAILAPTDPVLASDVQVLETSDRDRLRFSLTGEGGLNDGAAFPFVMLGIGLLGLHDLGTVGWRWLAVDVVWAIAGGLLIGGVLGMLVGTLVVYLRSRHKESVGLDEFLAQGRARRILQVSHRVVGDLYEQAFAVVVEFREQLRQADLAPDQTINKKPTFSSSLSSVRVGRRA